MSAQHNEENESMAYRFIKAVAHHAETMHGDRYLLLTINELGVEVVLQGETRTSIITTWRELENSLINPLPRVIEQITGKQQ